MLKKQSGISSEPQSVGTMLRKGVLACKHEETYLVQAKIHTDQPTR